MKDIISERKPVLPSLITSMELLVACCKIHL